MERSLIDTVLMLGLDVMLAMIVVLLILSAVEPVLRRSREARSARQAEVAHRREHGDLPSKGIVPSSPIGLTQDPPQRDEPLLPDWFASSLRRSSHRDASAPTGARREQRGSDEPREEEAA